LKMHVGYFAPGQTKDAQLSGLHFFPQDNLTCKPPLRVAFLFLGREPQPALQGSDGFII